MKKQDKKHLNSQELSAYVEGALKNNIKNAIQDHLDECDDCFMVYADIKFTYTDIEDYAPKTIPDEIVEILTSP